MAFSNRIFMSSLLPIATSKIQELPLSANKKTKELLPTTTVTATPPCISVAHKQSLTHEHSLVSRPSQDYMDGYRNKIKEVSWVLLNTEDAFECLIMIDALQHLAIDNHFQEEIHSILSRQYRRLMTNRGVIGVGDDDNDLYNVSLCFRLLRQDGYHVPADVFNSFKNKDGKFKLTLSEDLRGMMGLFEASQLGIEGEDVLDEANAFASKQLHAWVKTNLEEHQAEVVKNTLEHPYHKSLARLNAKHYIENLIRTNGINDIVQELAQMDFKIVQSLHQRELFQVSKWWRDLGIAQELKLARDQPVKWYMWSMALLSDPKFSEERIELTKPISLIYLMDDIFDVYGTLDELVLFTEAINKWELTEIGHLPHYMRVFLKAIYDITDEISYRVLKEHGWNPSDSLRKAWINLCNAFLVEAKWFSTGHLPKAEEYLKNGVISSGVHVVLVHIFFLLGQGITKESVDLVDNIPGIISYPATILRLWDDLGSAKDENQGGHDGSYIDCYMKEYGCSTVESAREQVVFMISNAWKRLNKECLSPNPFPQSFIKASLNMARMVSLMYSYDENQRLPILEEHIKSLLYESKTS